MGRPGAQLGHLVQWSMADAKDKQAPAQWDGTGITQVDDYAVVNPGPQSLYHGTAFPIKEVRASGELGRPAGARDGEAQSPGAGIS